MVKRDYIVARAASMFETQGVKSVRIDDIASELGMSKRTLYEMFDSKEALLKECMRHLFVEKQEKDVAGNRAASGCRGGDILPYRQTAQWKGKSRAQRKD
ncbi:MAG: TetR/AcrR family transcriptional regulator [Alistipes putredinis]|nr:MAG: TetR/AcrR family transcriptional regulator [Alistipes putredinis]